MTRFSLKNMTRQNLDISDWLFSLDCHNSWKWLLFFVQFVVKRGVIIFNINLHFTFYQKYCHNKFTYSHTNFIFQIWTPFQRFLKINKTFSGLTCSYIYLFKLRVSTFACSIKNAIEIFYCHFYSEPLEWTKRY